MHVRKLRFGFADYDVPFLWNESDPTFSAAANALSFLFLGIEKLITITVNEALPLITEPAVYEEAHAFVRQEGQHSMAHRQHAKALIKSHPALNETLDEVIAEYSRLATTAALEYRLAYIADMEATFTPAFKLLLDNADTLFAPGDDRVASLLLWHFVEEIEHRSSALIIFDSVVANPWYRMRLAPSVFNHATSVVVKTAEGFNKHVPLEDRRVDAMSMFGQYWKSALVQRFPSLNTFLAVDVPDNGPYMRPYREVPLREQLAAVYGVVRSQIPGHKPAKQKLPAFAAEWLARYEAGCDVTRWYTAARNEA
nr:metal-dependent hydrolase [Mycolicibacterium sphagni]